MCTEWTAAHQERVAADLTSLEIGDHLTVLRVGPADQGALPDAGPESFVTMTVLIEVVARSMELQVLGEVRGAWERLSEAAALLPLPLRRPGRSGITTYARLLAEPGDVAVEMWAAWQIARIIWREQCELSAFREDARLATSARPVLRDAGVHHLCWIDFNSPLYRRDGRFRGDRRVVDPSRARICGRATCLRRFGNPRAKAVSQSVWQDLGGLPGLRAAALTRLAELDAPAHWCGRPATSGLKVRCGRLRAWQFAQNWRDDLDYRPE